ncbi:MAG: 23S rRNA (uracil(1939)-C(5))-methyltransferase RlmD [Salinivirgaceae bacterium]|nr:23S rRNA (uracil(1939)-C(5))-methyltransferase RlmD [Salinivirgaceae bacterium]
MMRNKKESPIIEKIEITDIAAEGKAIAKHEGKVIFVPYVAPGDIVDLKITRKRRSYAEGTAIKFHEYSKDRTEPFCEHFGICGGCKWQHLSYEKQLHYKAKQVVDNLERIAKVPFPEPLPIIGSDSIKHYRNKLEYTFSDKRWFLPDEPFDQPASEIPGLGFHIPGRFDKVLDLKHCYLQPELSDKIRIAVKKYSIENELSYQNLRNHEGLLRNLIVRNSNTGEWMVIVVFGEEENKDAQIALMDFLKQSFPEITSLWYVINTKANDSIHDLEPQLHFGKPYLSEKMMHMEYQIGPKAFYQTNSEQAEKLYQIAYDFSQLTGDELVYDLYTGTGTIANLLANKAKEVVGVEYIEEAILDARKNSEINNVKNTTFIAGDMKDVLNSSFLEKHGYPDVIVTDPPRAGMHPKVIESILEAAPKKIVYISCNPATQARDIALMQPNYTISKVQPVDMFPNTHHVENVILLTRSEN